MVVVVIIVTDMDKVMVIAHLKVVINVEDQPKQVVINVEDQPKQVVIAVNVSIMDNMVVILMENH